MDGNGEVMKKILHICGFGYGGIQNVVYEICKRNSGNFSYYVMGTELDNREDENVERYIDIGVKLIYIQRNINKIEYIKFVYKTIKELKPDCVHLHQFYSSGMVALVAKICGVKTIIVQSHNTNSKEQNTIIRKVYKKIMKKMIDFCATDLIAVSMNAANELFYPKAIESDRFHLILNGVEFSLNGKNEKFVHPFFEKENSKVIVSVGRLTKQKNYLFLLDIMNEIHKIDSDVRLIIAGDGEDKEKLEKQINVYELQNNVDLIGFTDNVESLMESAILFILPSLWEGFGIVFLEAQIKGLMCIASDNVPEEADIGLLKRISLSESAAYWAEQCLFYLGKGKKEMLDYERVKNVEIEHVIRQYRKIYERM